MLRFDLVDHPVPELGAPNRDDLEPIHLASGCEVPLSPQPRWTS